jgi:hypothetical protein
MGVVLVLLLVIIAGAVLAIWGARADTSSAGQDRLTRQLFDCAEQGLAFGKQWFSINQRSNWDQFLSTDVCTLATPPVPCPPFPTGAPGTAPPNYPNGAPYTNTITVGSGTGSMALTYQVVIYNNEENIVPAPKCSQATPDPRCLYHDGDNTIVVYSQCRDPASGQSRSVQAVISAPNPDDGCGYKGQAGFGCRNQGNLN